MSADIMSTQAPSTSTRLKRGSSKASKHSHPLVAPSPQDDPALIVGLALAFSRQGSSDTRAIPSVVLDRLRHHARSGEPTCRLVLDCLNRRTGAGHRTVADQGAPPEIVTAHLTIEEDR